MSHAPPPLPTLPYQPPPQEIDIQIHSRKFLDGTRLKYLTQFEQWLYEDYKKHRIFCIQGSAGAGKTVLSAKLCSIYSPHRIIGIHFCQHDNTQRSAANNIIKNIAYQVIRSLILCHCTCHFSVHTSSM